MAKPAMQQLEGDDKNYNGAIHYLPCIFDAIQWQQQVKGCVPNTGLDSECYKQEHREIIHNLQTYAYTADYVKWTPVANKFRQISYSGATSGFIWLPVLTMTDGTSM